MTLRPRRGGSQHLTRQFVADCQASAAVWQGKRILTSCHSAAKPHNLKSSPFEMLRVTNRVLSEIFGPSLRSG